MVVALCGQLLRSEVKCCQWRNNLSSGSASNGVSSSSGVVQVISGEAQYGSSGDVVMQSSQASLSGFVRISSGDVYSAN